VKRHSDPFDIRIETGLSVALFTLSILSAQVTDFHAGFDPAATPICGDIV
jgi:hypothetical protein